jgi:hypothetical protein
VTRRPCRPSSNGSGPGGVGLIRLVSADTAPWIAHGASGTALRHECAWTRFTYVSGATDVLDQIRRQVWNAARRAGQSGFALWKNPKNLTPGQFLSSFIETDHSRESRSGQPGPATPAESVDSRFDQELLDRLVLEELVPEPPEAVLADGQLWRPPARPGKDTRRGIRRSGELPAVPRSHAGPEPSSRGSSGETRESLGVSESRESSGESLTGSVQGHRLGFLAAVSVGQGVESDSPVADSRDASLWRRQARHVHGNGTPQA